MTDYANLREQLSGQWANNPISNIELGCKATLLSQPERDTILSALETASKPEADTITTLRADVAALREGLESAASQFNQLRSTVAVRFDGRSEQVLWFALNKAFDDLAAARALLETNHAK